MSDVRPKRFLEHAITLGAVGAWLSIALSAGATTTLPPLREGPARVAAFEHHFETEVLPQYRTLGVSGSFRSKGFRPDDSTPERRIHYRTFRRTRFSAQAAEKGAIVISPTAARTRPSTPR